MTELPKEVGLLDDSAGVNRELNSLQQYQQQQKMMEELNKQKKQMLSKALAERCVHCVRYMCASIRRLFIICDIPSWCAGKSYKSLTFYSLAYAYFYI